MARQRTRIGARKPSVAPARQPTRKPESPAEPTHKGVAHPQPTAVIAGSDTRLKFTLFNLLGKPRAYYLVDRVELDRPRKKGSGTTVAHSILVIDRSGSMVDHISELKETLVKLLTLDEYSQFDLVVTLISYSSEGDLIIHFEREPIREIMKRGSKPLKEIKKIEVAGATCISQALDEAGKFVKGDELTCITLHSDGYANDPSPNDETRALEQLCAKFQDRPVFVNTIAYTDASDYRLLSRVANSVSGNCLKAGNIRQVYDSLYSTSKALGSSMTPPMEIPLGDDHDYQVFVSHAGNKVNGAADTLRIKGLQEDHDGLVYKYKRLSEKEYRALKDVPERQTSEAVLAFARANLAEGNLNTAKYALASTFDATLLERHGRALTNLQVAAMAQDLETVLFQPALLHEHEVLDHVPVNKRISVLALVRILGEHRDGYEVNLRHLKENYVRRGLRRVQGIRDDNGKLTPPGLKTEYLDPGDYAPVVSYDVNRNTANLNMLISRPVRLVPAAGGDAIIEVAGIQLDKLFLPKHYTLVGDGELNVKELKLRISDQKLFDRLCAEGVLAKDGRTASKFDPDIDYTLRLDILPLVPPFEGPVQLDGIFEDLAEVKVLSSLCTACLEEESDLYTKDQLAELRDHYLSKNLYVNFPMANPYADLQQALAEGSVDARVSYKIDLGNRTILNLGKLMSANKFLDRLYEVHDASGRKIDKAGCDALLEPGMTVKHKHLSPRTKVTKADEFMRRLFDDFLGLADNGTAVGVLKRVGAAGLCKIVGSRTRPGQPEYVAALTDAQRKLDRYADGLFHERVSPLVFYMGSTGLLPDEMDVKALTSEQITTRYPELTLSKDERDGTFFEIGGTILTVYARTELFSR
jgi:Mg-chelatase subunit ChlD